MKSTNEQTNEVAEVSMPLDKPMLTSQSDSVELYHALCDRLIELIEKTNEVERLRELLNRAIEIAKEYQKHARENINEDCDWSMHGTHKKFAEFQNAITQIAPAPEEPKTSAHPDDHLHAWMLLQEEINKEVAGELQNIRDEIQKLKQK